MLLKRDAFAHISSFNLHRTAFNSHEEGLQAAGSHYNSYPSLNNRPSLHQFRAEKINSQSKQSHRFHRWTKQNSPLGIVGDADLLSTVVLKQKQGSLE
jgi:hypothetical protein